MWDPSTDQSLDRLYQQAADSIGASGGAGDAAAHSAQIYEGFRNLSHSLDHATYYGILPLAFAILVLTENFRAQSEGTPFRVASVVGRAVAVVALLLGYGTLCRLITGLAGAGSGWMNTDHLGTVVQDSGAALSSAWSNLNQGHEHWWEDFSSIGPFFELLFIWLIVVVCALFAYVVGLLLSMAQAVLLAILLAVGKTCITMSLLPGVSLGKSWAKLLAQVAAWSTIAGIISALIVSKATSIKYLIAGAELLPLLKAAAQFVILGVCTLYVPKITSAIFAGASSAAPGVLGSLAAGWAGARLAQRYVFGGPKPAATPSPGPDGESPERGGAGPGSPHGDRRPHKAQFRHTGRLFSAAGAAAAARQGRVAWPVAGPPRPPGGQQPQAARGFRPAPAHEARRLDASPGAPSAAAVDTRPGSASPTASPALDAATRAAAPPDPRSHPRSSPVPPAAMTHPTDVAVDSRPADADAPSRSARRPLALIVPADDSAGSLAPSAQEPRRPANSSATREAAHGAAASQAPSSIPAAHGAPAMRASGAAPAPRVPGTARSPAIVAGVIQGAPPAGPAQRASLRANGSTPPSSFSVPAAARRDGAAQLAHPRLVARANPSSPGGRPAAAPATEPADSIARPPRARPPAEPFDHRGTVPPAPDDSPTLPRHRGGR